MSDESTATAKASKSEAIEKRLTRLEALMRIIQKEAKAHFGKDIEAESKKAGSVKVWLAVLLAMVMAAGLAFAADKTIWDGVSAGDVSTLGNAKFVSDQAGSITLTVDKITATGGITAPLSGALSAANLTAGTTASAINGTSITNLSAANLRAGTAATAINGAAITNLSAANLVAGTAATAINGASITNLSAANLTAGTAASAINGAAITNMSAANVAITTGAWITNTCIAATGQTNTYVFAPYGTGKYIVNSITTSP